MSCDWRRWVMIILHSEERQPATPAKPVCPPSTADMRSVHHYCLPLYIMMSVLTSSEGTYCYYEALQKLQDLQNMVGNEGDIELYCPDPNEPQDCWKEKLQCFQAELNVLNFEFAGASKKNVTLIITELIEQFDSYLLHLDKSKGCQQCEIYKEQPAETFLTSLRRFMQFQMTYKCNDK